jgi:toxin ParE1/3/4
VTWSLIIEPEAGDELLEAAQWYDARRPGLGQDLVEEVDAALARVLEAPRTFPTVADNPDARRVLVDRFPYAVVFMPDTVRGVVTVVAFAHGRREPLFWAKRKPTL